MQLVSILALTLLGQSSAVAFGQGETVYRFSTIGFAQGFEFPELVTDTGDQLDVDLYFTEVLDVTAFSGSATTTGIINEPIGVLLEMSVSGNILYSANGPATYNSRCCFGDFLDGFQVGEGFQIDSAALEPEVSPASLGDISEFTFPFVRVGDVLPDDRYPTSTSDINWEAFFVGQPDQQPHFLLRSQGRELRIQIDPAQTTLQRESVFDSSFE